MPRRRGSDSSNEVFVLPSDQDLLPQTLTVAAVTRARELFDGANAGEVVRELMARPPQAEFE